MTVVAIKREKGHIVRVVFKGGKSILLDLDFCIQKCIHEGDELSDGQIEEYLSESDYIRAKSRALWLLDRYEYTERRLSQKLKSAGFSDKASSRALTRLKELGVVDDIKLSLRYAQDCARRGISKKEAYSKLYAKGFNSETVKRALENTVFDEHSQIRELLEKKYKSKLMANEKDKVYAALIRKGFSYGAVRDVLKEYISELDFYGED